MSLESHLRDRDLRALFDHLVDEVNQTVGQCQVLSLPCCIHLVGDHDFLAVLPKRDRLEIRFALRRQLTSSKVTRSARISNTSYKHSVDVRTTADIDDTLLGWVREAYELDGTLSRGRTAAGRPAGTPGG
ncbi:DUF5655 domain-containing protein [Intrasporangium sp.]|uniref:DUF5655 domain-containing protein n=1 Tax=Intrasporangium sp. TaxID=1925024 RepID=UPI0029395DAE|nr:DUF5655 domain-containing protein [Intrasporangium sp.]MDV3221778.1 DUF5655 domain-containing protein [Intrasporangium sp.]